MAKIAAGLTLGLLIGVACRWFDIPLPGPPKLVGALLVVSMTVGYLATDKLISARFSAKAPASTQNMCGGPTGDIVSAPPTCESVKNLDSSRNLK
jgi:XapX domain-containing protein